MEYELVYRLAFAKADFAFGWVYIYVHQLWRHVEKHYESRMALEMEDVMVGLPNGMGNDLVANKSVIHEKILSLARSPGINRQRDHSRQMQSGCLARDHYRALDKFGPQYGFYPLG